MKNNLNIIDKIFKCYYNRFHCKWVVVLSVKGDKFIKRLYFDFYEEASLIKPGMELQDEDL